MRSESRAFLALVVAVLVVAVVGSTYLYLTPRSLPTTLPVLEGTTFSSNDTWHWAAYFNVSSPDALLVGAWTAFDGFGTPGLVVANGSVAPPGRPSLVRCPPALTRPYSEYNGSIDRLVHMGAHTIYWGTFCSAASKIIVTRAIQLDLLPLV